MLATSRSGFQSAVVENIQMLYFCPRSLVFFLIQNTLYKTRRKKEFYCQKILEIEKENAMNFLCALPIWI